MQAYILAGEGGQGVIQFPSYLKISDLHDSRVIRFRGGASVRRAEPRVNQSFLKRP